MGCTYATATAQPDAVGGVPINKRGSMKDRTAKVTEDLKASPYVNFDQAGVDFATIVEVLSKMKEKGDGSLSKLGLNKNKLEDVSEEDWKSFFAALPSSLIHLDLSVNGLGNQGGKGARALASTLGEAVTLRELYLDGNGLGQDAGAGLKELLPAFGKLGMLKVLGLSNNKLGAGIAELAPVLGKMVGLEELELAKNDLHELPASQWKVLVAACSGSVLISMSGNRLQRDSIEVLWDALPAQCKVDFGMRKELVEASERLASSGAHTIQFVPGQHVGVDNIDWAGSIYHFSKLIQPLSINVRQQVATLEFAANTLQNSGMESLVRDVLKHLPAVSSLAFIKAAGGKNPINLKDIIEGSGAVIDVEGIVGGATLLRALQPKQASFKVLNLGNTNLGVGGAKCLADAAVAMPDLSGLGLSSNNIALESGVMEALTPALTVLSKLQILDLSENSLGHAQEKAPDKLTAMLRSIPNSVTALYLSDNQLGHFEGAPFKVLGTLLKDKVKLQALELSGNELRGKCLEDGQGVGLLPSDYQEFFKVLPRSVTALDLSRNNYGMYEGAGARCVAPSLTQVAGLQVLHLGSNYLEPAMEKIVLEFLPEGCRLERDIELKRTLVTS